MFLVEKHLGMNYDYVMWLDSDTLIRDFSLDLGDFLEKYSSDVFAGFDHRPSNAVVNAGVFVFKNTEKGRAIMREITSQYLSPGFQKLCVTKDGDLRGMWAYTCYEQGVLNKVLVKYRNNCTLFTKEVFWQNTACPKPEERVFIQHLYGRKEAYRNKVFSKIVNGV
jgi:hypothetical protein